MPSVRAASSSPISVASPRDFPVRSGASSAVLHAASVRPRKPSTGSAAHGRREIRARPRGRARRAASRRCTARIRFSVSVPVLSVQITVVEPSVSTALRRLTSAPRRASPATPTASASVIVGSSPSGTFATISPIAKVNASSERQAGGEQPDREEREADEHRDERDEPRDAPHLALERALLDLHPLGERRDPAELRLHPGREDERLRLAADAGRAAEDEVARLEQRAGRSCRSAERSTGCDSPGQRREVDVERALEEARVGRDPVALGEQQDVAGHERRARRRLPVPVAEHRAPGRAGSAQRLDRALGLPLLHEREERRSGRSRRRSRAPRTARRRRTRAPPRPRAAARAGG